MSSFSPAEVAQRLAMVRSSAARLPQTTERLSHGGPAFFVRDKRCFVMFLDNHHGDGRLAVWAAAPDGVQHIVVESEPEQFFVPPYVGHRGWIGVHLREVGQAELDAIIEQAYRTVASAALVRLLEQR
jgi:hypothetical protein